MNREGGLQYVSYLMVADLNWRVAEFITLDIFPIHLSCFNIFMGGKVGKWQKHVGQNCACIT